MEMMKDILDEAKEIRSGNRESDYGDAVTNFNNISNMASMIAGHKITAKDCVIVQMAVKLCRQRYKEKRDNLVDLAGYTDIWQRIIDKENETE